MGRQGRGAGHLSLDSPCSGLCGRRLSAGQNPGQSGVAPAQHRPARYPRYHGHRLPADRQPGHDVTQLSRLQPGRRVVGGDSGEG